MSTNQPETNQLPHLETFAKAAELVNFTATAHAFGMTQAAVSQRIHALEQNLNVSLFHRQGGHVVLTEAGRRLYPFARQILMLHQEARQEVSGRKAPITGELCLSASSIPGEHLLPKLLAVFQQKYPHIKVRATAADSEVVLYQVEQGKVHLGLVGMRTDNPNLQFRCFACDALAVIVPGDHPWKRRKRISVEQLCRLPLILREEGSGSRWCLEQALSKAGKSLRDLSRVALELGSNEAIKEAVLCGMGAAILSMRAVEKELESGQLHALQVADLPLLREMFAVWNQQRVLTIPAQLFLDLLEPCKQSHQHS